MVSLSFTSSHATIVPITPSSAPARVFRFDGGLDTPLEKRPFATAADALFSANLDERDGKPSFVWLDVTNPTASEVSSIAGALGLHALTERDCLQGVPQDKCEVFPDYCVVGMHVSIGVHLLVILLPTALITLHPQHMNLCEKVSQNLLIEWETTRIRRAAARETPAEAATLVESSSMGSGENGGGGDNKKAILGGGFDDRSVNVWVMTQLLEEMTQSMEPRVHFAMSEVDTLTELVFMLGVKDSTELLMRVGRAMRSLAELRRHLKPKREVMRRLVKEERHRIFSREVQVYFGNTLDRVVRMIERVEGAIDVLNTIQNNYLGQISIEMSASSHRLSKMMQQLNIVSMIMLPLGVVVGLFGMNVTVPGQTTDGDKPLWFYVILAGLILFSIVSWKLLTRLGFSVKDL